MQRYVVHKVGIGSLGRLIGTWFSIIGLAVGLISAIVSVVNIFANNSYSLLGGIGISILVILGWLLVYPVVMFLVGWVQGAILAIIFNVVVSGSGGLSVHLEETNMDGTPKLKAGK